MTEQTKNAKSSEVINTDWQEKVVSLQEAMKDISPGMSIFIGTGAAEPRSLVKHLMNSTAPNLTDLELIQLVSLGDAISPEQIAAQKYRLKTFFSGWIASEAITNGTIDYIPSRHSTIPYLLKSGRLPVDVAFVQISPPNKSGYCSLGLSIDVTLPMLEKASIIIGEVNELVPFTYGDTLIPVSDFDCLIRSEEPLITIPRWPFDETYDRLAANVASVILDGSCLSFTNGPLFEALGRHLQEKRNLGVHSAFLTDPLMDLIKSGAVTNRYKEFMSGTSVASYVLGTNELYAWVHDNPLIALQGADKVLDPLQIGLNPKTVFVIPVRKVDLSGRIALPFGKRNVGAGSGEIMDFFNGAEVSRGGKTIFALPSRNSKGESNICLSVDDFPNHFGMKELVNIVVTEYGVANLMGCTLRERAQFLIDIAHPDDRLALVEAGKKAKILHPDQVYIAENDRRYPLEISSKYVFENKLEMRFRAIKPSDEAELRRLFYRFLDSDIYHPHFVNRKIISRAELKEYVNPNYQTVMSIVGVVGDAGRGKVVAEARYDKLPSKSFADVTIIVDSAYQNLGIASHLYGLLMKAARERGIEGFTTYVPAANEEKIKVFKKGSGSIKAELKEGIFQLQIPFGQEDE